MLSEIADEGGHVRWEAPRMGRSIGGGRGDEGFSDALFDPRILWT